MIIDKLDYIKCEECYRLAIERIAAFAIDPENLAMSVVRDFETGGILI